ncbi:MAG: phage baseplate assembly protein [Bacilli bacterium]|nr:phage baseplate assembly protein [Bacilli bacterium]
MRNDTEVKWWRSIYNSIILKRCTVQSVNDVNDIPTMQIKYLKDVIKIVQKLGLYGICGNPPKGSSGILFPILGSDSNLVCLADDIKNRFKDLKEGEVVIGNYLTKSFIKFKEDGGVEIHAKYITQVAEDGDISLSAGNNIINSAQATNINNPLNVNDNVTVSKKVTATEDVIGGGKSLKTHIHTGGTIDGKTGTPV